MTPLLPSLPCYLNGDFTILPDAKISVMDRGFIFGDGVYEVIPAYEGALFRFDDHMARLDRSLAETRMRNPMTHAQWRAIAQTLLDSHRQSIPAGEPPADIQSVYIQVTRGVALRNHVMPTDIEPTVFAMADRMGVPTAQQQDQGVACITADDFRWEKAHIKSTSLLGAVFARQLSYDVGAMETVMFRGDNLSEAAASNIWVVKDGHLAGVPKNNLALTGVRYGLIAEICEAQGIAFELRPITRAEVLAADELILSSAVREVLAITTLDGKPVANGEPGPIYRKLRAGYDQAKQRSIQQHKAAMNTPATTPQADPRKDSLIEYPSLFPIKVMGAKVDGFVNAVTSIARQFDPKFDASTVELRDSKAGNYLGITITINATSREQLDELYRTLSTHPMVKMVL